MLMTGARSLAGVAVLVVDDDEDLRQELRSVVALAGAEVHDASCAPDAREKLEKHHYDVLLSDIEMPYEDGCALVASVRQSLNPRLRGIAAAALSGHDSVATRRRAWDAGFDVFLSKTASVRAIIRALEELSAHSARLPEGDATPRGSL